MNEPLLEMAVPSSPGKIDLEAINRSLASVLRTEPAELSHGAEVSLADKIILCGILGGKDVGKSTLINALARTTVSLDTDEVGRGTDRPMIFAHRDAALAVEHRLTTLGLVEPFDITPHEIDDLRNVVLVDFPDFDSEFQKHLDVVVRLAPVMDRLIWVLTPRKLGDRVWVRSFREVIKGSRNVYCVLNKVDELLNDDNPFNGARGGGSATSSAIDRSTAFWKQQDQWFLDGVRSADCDVSAPQRFQLAAAFPTVDQFVRRIGERWDDPQWDRYKADKNSVLETARLACGDLDRLRNTVLSPLTTTEALNIKEDNRRCESQANIIRLRDHYRLDELTEQLAFACDEGHGLDVLEEAFPNSFRGAITDRLRSQLRTDAELADEVLQFRVQEWPLLRLVYWPFGWLSRSLGRRIPSPSSANSPSAAPADNPLHITRSRSLMDRIQMVRARIQADHDALLRRLDIESEWPGVKQCESQLRGAFDLLPADYEARLLTAIRSRLRRPPFFAKLGLWLIFLWFPLFQPIMAGVLGIWSGGGEIRLAEGLYQVVSALSAVHLLSGFGIVIGVFIAILAGMYARAVKRVRGCQDEWNQRSPLEDEIDSAIEACVLQPLIQPLRERRSQLDALIHCLSVP